MIEYKEDIRQTRKGNVGSSDSRMLNQIAELGYVPKSAYNRLAIVKGLCEQQDIPYTNAIRFGDEMEQAIFEHLHSVDERYESNPKWISKEYSRKNVKCLTHVDAVLKDYDKKILYAYEIKTSKFTFEQVRNEYKYQLSHHYKLALEQAKELGKDWKVKVCLVLYSSDGLDLSQPQEFDVNRLTIKELRKFERYDLNKAMDIINDFLETFDTYYQGDAIDANMLPVNVKTQFDAIATTLAEIKEREQKVNEFKKRLYDFMLNKDIKSIKNEMFNIVRIDKTESKSFDYKRYIDDMKKEHPRKANKIVKAYTKTTTRQGYCTIKVKGE